MLAPDLSANRTVRPSTHFQRNIQTLYFFILLRAGRQDLFGHDAVGPFDQRNKNGSIAELCVPIRKIVFRDPTGPGAIPSSKDWNVFGDNLLAQLAERRPTNGNHRVHGSFSHKIVRVSSQEYLNFVASVCQG